MNTKRIKIGVGFATGRRHFQKVLKTYIYNWHEECGLAQNESIEIHPIVAYDLRFANAKKTDFTNIQNDLRDLVGDIYFADTEFIKKETDDMIRRGILSEKEVHLLFGSGYAGKRNAVLYTALKKGMDYLLFLDDDEYPIAVTNTRSTAVWGGQHVLKTHLEYIKNADITNGYHCGYISPIPQITFNDTLKKEDFKQFIEALSNDIIRWDTIHSLMKNGGVTYADPGIITADQAEEVQETNRTKFISGSNLCIRLAGQKQIYPFYNPPGARGEDTFLSTCLTGSKVLRVPCYTFHDGFSTYKHLMDGVLPIKLKPILPDSGKVIDRFYNCCVGWVRYKPLLLYITQREDYGRRITEMRSALDETLPKVSRYFGKDDFMKIRKELDRYDANVRKHYDQFQKTKEVWERVLEDLRCEA
ncbi:MAG: Glycosyltransferase family 1 protein [Eubacteriales bacterium]